MGEKKRERKFVLPPSQSFPGSKKERKGGDQKVERRKEEESFFFPVAKGPLLSVSEDVEKRGEGRNKNKKSVQRPPARQ